MAKSNNKFTDMVPFLLVLGVFCAISVYLLTSFFMTMRGEIYQASVLLAANPITGEVHDAPSGYIFKDVPYSHENATAILYFRDTNIVSGYEDGTFKPENEVNRAEFLKVLVGALNADISGTHYKNCFTDVKEEWFAPYICYAKAQGWVGGYADGSYQPAKSVNMAESIKITDVAFGYEVPAASSGQLWFEPYVNVAIEHDLVGRIDTSAEGLSSSMRRATTVELIYQAMRDSGMVGATI